MENINLRIKEVKEKINEKDRIDRLLNDIYNEKVALEEKTEELRVLLKKEELDVKKLNGISIAHLIHIIKGDKADALQDENNEVLAAKLKYDGAVTELERLKEEINKLNERKFQLNGAEVEYSTLLETKEEFLKNENNPLYNEICVLEEELIELTSKKKEIGEAKEAGYNLKEALDNARRELDSAEGWGTYDLFGGGIFADMNKHSHIDEARNHIDNVQYLLNKFHRELQDVVSTKDITIEISPSLKFSDFFFDNFFTDYAVQKEIESSIERVDNTIYEVEGLVSRLDDELEVVDKRIKQVNSKRRDLIERV